MQKEVIMYGAHNFSMGRCHSVRRSKRAMVSTIWRDGNKLYYVTEEGGIAPQRVVYELPDELFALLENGERTLLEISWKIKMIVGHQRKKKVNQPKRVYTKVSHLFD